MIRDGVPLAPFTTLELGGPARHFAEATDEAGVVEALRWADARKLPVAMLGGGSNLVVADAGFDGLVVRMATRGVRFETSKGEAEVTAAAGEPWDALVAEAVARGLGGLECLSGIPGLVGATPIQNVGAYGQEVAETIRAVRVLERGTWRTHELPPAACGFGYRDSAFKRAPARFVVLAVTFGLRPGGAPALRYRELAESLVRRGQAPTLADARAAVLALRAKKSMLVTAGRSQPAQRRLVLHEPDRRSGRGRRPWPRAPSPRRRQDAALAGPGRAGSSSRPAGSSSAPASRRGLRAVPSASPARTRWPSSTTAAARPRRCCARPGDPRGGPGAVRRHPGPGADFRRRLLEPRLRLSI